jgi:hypothetical protein
MQPLWLPKRCRAGRVSRPSCGGMEALQEADMPTFTTWQVITLAAVFFIGMLVIYLAWRFAPRQQTPAFDDPFFWNGRNYLFPYGIVASVLALVDPKDRAFAKKVLKAMREGKPISKQAAAQYDAILGIAIDKKDELDPSFIKMRSNEAQEMYRRMKAGRR